MDLSWHWAAYGKHPVAKDFFKVGKDFSLGKGFSDWIEKGYQILMTKKTARPGLCSWRFWARGVGKDGLACGLVRDSSDRVGRPYPLLFMGMGPLKGWEDQWDLLPFACEKTWDQIEYLASLVVTDFKKLEMEVQNIRPPSPEWSEFYSHRENFRDELASTSNESCCDSQDLDQESKPMEKTEFYISLDEGPFKDQFTRIGFWHSLFRTHLKAVPNAVFMGGTFEKAYLALFRRPLVPSDFMELWSISSGEVCAAGTYPFQVIPLGKRGTIS
jgi:type VI secretion system protein VasJ